MKNRRLNLRLKIVAFPPEVLSLIFLQYQAYHFKLALSLGLYQRAHYGWIIIAHVCHRWRYIALDTAKLWRRIFVADSEITETTIARSKQCLIHINTTACTMATPLAMAFRELGRAESLLCITTPAIVNELAGTVLPTALSLHTLVVGASPSTPLSSSWRLPTIFRSIECVNLTHLRVSGYQVDFTEPIFQRSLKTLAISATHGSPVTWDNLFRCLQSLPSLEQLTLCAGLPPVGQTADVGSGRVTLRRLKRLFLMDYPRFIQLFLGHVRLPANTIMNIISAVPVGPLNGIIQVSVTLLGWVITRMWDAGGNQAGAVYRSVAIQWCRPLPSTNFGLGDIDLVYAWVCASHQVLTVDNLVTRPVSAFPLSISTSPRPGNMQNNMESLKLLCRGLRLSELTVLFLDKRALAYFCDKDAFTALGSLSNLKTLAVTGAVEHLCRLLAVEDDLPGGGDGSQDVRYALPMLQELVLRAMEISSGDIARLVLIFTLRKARNALVKMLRLDQCTGLEEADIGAFGDLVGSVERT